MDANARGTQLRSRRRPPRPPRPAVGAAIILTRAEHADVDITSAHLEAAGPDDPNFGTPGAQVFYIDSNVVNGEPNVPDFLGDSGIPASTIASRTGAAPSSS